MTDPHDATGLRDVLERATDRIESPPLANRAIVGARQRRRRHRTVAVAALVVSTLAVVIGLPTLDLGNSSAPTEPGPTTPSEPIRPDPSVIQSRWDPRTVGDLPRAPEYLPGVPAEITPDDSAPLLADSPIDSAALVVDRSDSAGFATGIDLLAADGSWRRIPVQPRSWLESELSPSGTRLVIADHYADNYKGALHIWDVSTGEVTQPALPEGFRSTISDMLVAGWVDDDTVILDDRTGGWLLDVQTGAAHRVPYPRDPYNNLWAVDQGGTVLESSGSRANPVLLEWVDGEPRSVSMAATGRLEFVGVSDELVAGETFEDGPSPGFQLVVADRERLEPTAVLPIRDPEANYSNGGGRGLQVLAVRNDGTVLLSVADLVSGGGVSIVAWDSDTGDLSLVAHCEGWRPSFAPNVLR